MDASHPDDKKRNEPRKRYRDDDDEDSKRIKGTARGVDEKESSAVDIPTKAVDEKDTSLDPPEVHNEQTNQYLDGLLREKTQATCNDQPQPRQESAAGETPQIPDAETTLDPQVQKDAEATLIYTTSGMLIETKYI